uniref:(northern house mosquito) hypothetical protein n=1 Tax=Culex pipiens TaxID=7175 RepID=A0A8D8E4W1_CULPI
MRDRWAASAVVFLAWAAWMLPTTVVGKQMVCRIDDPSKVRDCRALADCAYRIYPIEFAQQGADQGNNVICGGLNNLVSLYDGAGACRYFGDLISTNAGRTGFATTVQQQLSNGQFRGVDLRCDPTVNGVNQTAYNGALKKLRQFLGRGFTIFAKVDNPDLDPVVIQTLNEDIDIISCPGEEDATTLRAYIANGGIPTRVVIDVLEPPVLTCPINTRPVDVAGRIVQENNLFGATIQVDRDDVNNDCGEGTFPKTRRLKDALDADPNACDFDGFEPDPTDRSRFYGCGGGKRELHQCPPGQLFDGLNGTCIPFIRMECNETTCTILSPLDVNNQTEFIPVPVFFPQEPTTTVLTTLPPTTTTPSN